MKEAYRAHYNVYLSGPQSVAESILHITLCYVRLMLLRDLMVVFKQYCAEKLRVRQLQIKSFAYRFLHLCINT